MNSFQAAKSSLRRRLFSCLLFAVLLSLCACGGGGVSMSVVLTPAEGTSTPADGLSAVTISVTVKKDGELANDGTVTVSTNLGALGTATSTRDNNQQKLTVAPSMGDVEIQLTSVQAGTATVRIEYTGKDSGVVEASEEVEILFKYALAPEPAKVATIEFISADPETIKIFNTSAEGQTSTKLTFQVLDKLNLPIQDVQIYFAIPKPLGTASIVPMTVKSDVNGYAVTYLTSGRVAGVAEVIAGTERYDNQSSDYVAGTAKIHVVAGSASYNNFTIGCKSRVIDATIYGTQMQCGAFVADRDTQEIPNQPVLFAVEAGAVIPKVYTGNNGQVETTYTVQEPIPFPVIRDTSLNRTDMSPLASAFTGNPTLLESFFTSLIHRRVDFSSYTHNPDPEEVPSITVGEFGYKMPIDEKEYYQPFYDSNYWPGLDERHPRDGLVTLIGITGGEELLTKDVNQNGICDEGDTFLAMAEPFIDRNDDGKYNEGEYFLDIDGNGVHTQAVGDSEHLPYKQSSDCSLWRKNTQIWKQWKFLWLFPERYYAGFMLLETENEGETSMLGQKVGHISLSEGKAASLSLYMLDKNLNSIGSNGTLTCSQESDVSVQVSPASLTIDGSVGTVPVATISVSATPKESSSEDGESTYKPGTATVQCSLTIASSGNIATASLDVTAK